MKEFNAAQKRIIAAVPTNWVDSLLTGPDGIGKPPYDCRHIEKLLRGVQDQVKAAVTKEPRLRAAKARGAQRKRRG